MKILFCEYNLFMQRDVEEAFTRMGIDFRCASYVFKNADSDDFYCTHLRRFLTEDTYDAVFSVNLIPVIADVCHEMSIPYLAWCYDACWAFTREDILFFPTTFIFHFDRRSCEDYRQCGYPNVFHMPLAANCHRLDRLSASPAQQQEYHSDVCFLGNMYEKYLTETPWFSSLLASSDLENLLRYIDEQTLRYTRHTLWDDITPEYIADLNTRALQRGAIKRIPLIATCSSMIAGRQRDLVLHHIAERFPLTLYTNSITNPVPKAAYKWRAGYYSQMPFVFRHATVNLNLTIPPIQTGLSLRVLDILGAGGFLLSNRQEELSDFFHIGKELDTYDTLEELTDKLSFYLAHPDTARKIAENGHTAVKERFSFEGQLAKIFQYAGLSL